MNDRDKTIGKSKSRFMNVIIDYCQKYGNIRKFCYKYKRDKKLQNKVGDNENVLLLLLPMTFLFLVMKIKSILFWMGP